MFRTAAFAAILSFLAAPVAAQATRTWVSGVGDDVNPCSRTAPCKTFAGAVSKTAAGGEITVLDPGGYGAVTITKSLSIVADGDAGSILASQTTGVVVNAGPSDIVSLRGLNIEGSVNGVNGVRFIAGGVLHIQDSLIRNFRAAAPGGNGVLFAPAAGSELYIVDSIIADNGAAGTSAGVRVEPGAAGRASVTLDNVRLLNNAVGLSATGAGAQVWIGRSTIAGNAIAIEATGGAVVSSYGDNAIQGNQADGARPAAATKR